jgi:hypothetical protein
LGEAVPDSTTDLNNILLEFHASTATIAEPSSSKGVMNVLSCYFYPGWHSFEDGNKLRSMGLSCG